MRTRIKRKLAALMTVVLMFTMNQPVLARGGANPKLTITVNDKVIKTFGDVEVDEITGKYTCSLGYVYPGDIVGAIPAIGDPFLSDGPYDACKYCDWEGADLNNDSNFEKDGTNNSYIYTVKDYLDFETASSESKPVNRWEMSIVFSAAAMTPGPESLESQHLMTESGVYSVFIDHFEFRPASVYAVRADEASFKGQEVTISPDHFSPGEIEQIEIEGLEDTEDYEFTGYTFVFENDSEGRSHNAEKNSSGKYIIPLTDDNVVIYAQWSVLDPDINVVQIIYPDNKAYFELDNTVVNAEGKSLTADNASAKVQIKVDPSIAKKDITLKADKTGFFGMELKEADAKKTATVSGNLALYYSTPVENVQTRTFYVAAAKSGFDDTKAEDIEKEGRRAGKTTVKAYAGTKELADFTVYVNGYDTVEGVYYEKGVKVTNESRKVGKTQYYFDKDGNRVTGDKIILLDNKARLLVIDGNLVKNGVYKFTDDTTEKYYCVEDETGYILTGFIDEQYRLQFGFSPITCVYYADPANGSALVNDALVTIEGNEYYFDKECKLALSSATADEYENNEGKWSYYVNKDGSVAKNGLFKVAGVDRLFREDGSIVSYADKDVKEGKITVDGISYVINETTSEAKKEFTWTKESVDWTVKYSDTAGKDGTAKAVFHLKSDASENNTVDVPATPDQISITEIEGIKKTFKATITYDGQSFEDEITVKKGIDLIDGKYYVKDADGNVIKGWITDTFTATENASEGVYYADPDADGALVIGALKKIDDITYYFDAEGKKVTASTNAKDYEASPDGNYYVNATGSVALGGIFKVADVDRLFRENGTIVSYTDEDVAEGKITVAGLVYLIDKDTNEAKIEKRVNAKFVWKKNKPSTFEKSTPPPINEFEITYNVEGSTEKKTVSGNVAAVADPANYDNRTDLKKLTFTFTASGADLAGFFSDAEGTKPLTANPAVWTYTFKSGSSKGSGAGIEIVGLEKEYKFSGTAIKPAITVIDYSRGITLAEGTDYKIGYKDNTKIGTATVTVQGKGNYTGKNVTAKFKIVSVTGGIEGLATKVNKVEKIAFNPTYTGEPQAPEKVTVVADGESIVYEWKDGEFRKITDTTKDVGITIVNNVNAGTATVAAVGADGKAKKANFKINKVDLSAVSAELLAVEVDEEAAYLAKGAQPAVNVTYTPVGGSEIELINGQDFKVEYKYANKKNAGVGNTIKIKGYGANFTKAKEVTDKPFKIVKHELQDEDIVQVDAYTGINAKKVKVVVKDSAGVVIPAKQYEVHVFTEEGLEITAVKNAKLEAGKEYTVQVKASATGNLEGEASAKVTAQANIGKAKAKLSASLKKDGVAYTGEPIDLENYRSGELIINYFESGIKLTLKGVGDLTYGEDFEVAGYMNNVNKGTMTVYVRGISDKCSGTLGIKIKISAKKMEMEMF